MDVKASSGRKASKSVILSRSFVVCTKGISLVCLPVLSDLSKAV